MAVFCTKTKKRGSILVECLIALTLFTFISFTYSDLIIQQQNISASHSIFVNSLTRLVSLMDSFPINFSANPNIIISTTTSILTPCLQKDIYRASWKLHLSTSTLDFSKQKTDTRLIQTLGYDCGGQALYSLSTTTTILSVFPTVIFPVAIDAISNTVIFGGFSSISTSSTLYITSTDTQGNLSPTTLKELNATVTAVDATRDAIFLGTSGTSSQVRIIEPKTYLEIAKINLPGVSGSFPDARSIIYFDQKLYVGTHRTAGNEFHIYNVSNANSPLWLGSVELNHNINQIQIRDNYAYLATSGNTNDIIIVDITNPQKPIERSAVSFNGNEDTFCIDISGNLLYAGRAKSKTASEPEFIISDISSSTKPLQLGSLFLNSAVVAIQVFGEYAYIITTTTNSHFLRIISIVDPQKPSEVRKVSLPTEPVNLEYQNGNLFVALKDNGIITIKP